MSRAIIRRIVHLVMTTSWLAGAQQVRLPDTPQTLHTAPAPSDRFPAKWYPQVGDGTDVSPAPVLNNPYTAILATKASTPRSGEPPPRETHDLQVRDRFGRARVESQNGGMLLDGKDVLTKEIQVWDPVSHCRFHWTQQTTDDPLPPKLAFVTCRPKTLRYTEFNPFEITFDIADGTTTHGDTTTRVEHLTPLQTDGITISRLRVTNEFHDGQGNVSKLSTETWYSPDLKELIRIGEEETGYQTLTNIRRIDPDPKLFYPPEGYRIEQQSGP